MLNILLQTAALLDRRERSLVLGITLCLLGSVFLETVSVALIFPLARILIDPDTVFRYPLLRHAYLWLGFHEAQHFLVASALAFLLVIILKSVYNALLTAYQERLCHQISSRIGTRLLTGYLREPWSEHLKRNSAELINVADVMSGWPLTNALRGYPVIATEGLLSVALLAILLWVAPRAALLCIVIFGAALFVSHNFIRRRLMTLSEENARLGAARIQLLQESLSSFKEIKILGREQQFIDEYAHARQRDAANLTRLLVWQNIPRALVEPMAVGTMTAAILAIGSSAASDPHATAAVLGLFAVASVRLTPSLTRMLVAANSIRASGAPLARIHADLAVPVEVEGRSTAAPVPLLSKDIRVQNISFCYPNHANAVLHQLSLTIAKGETVGITGSSGSGKSTLADVLTGLLRPHAGSVLVDGVDISDDIKGWQQQIGYIPQTVSLIDATLPENIALGIKAEDINAQRMQEAIMLAQLDGVVLKMLPDARLGERGVRLSGGERQRIGIARALYHGRSVLVMDEATSALDGETENEIGMALSRLHGKFTILIIAHRLSTMRHCDRVLILDEGKIASCGTPHEIERRFSEWGTRALDGPSTAA